MWNDFTLYWLIPIYKLDMDWLIVLIVLMALVFLSYFLTFYLVLLFLLLGCLASLFGCFHWTPVWEAYMVWYILFSVFNSLHFDYAWLSCIASLLHQLIPYCFLFPLGYWGKAIVTFHELPFQWWSFCCNVVPPLVHSITSNNIKVFGA
jgi:hypothetical protein